MDKKNTLSLLLLVFLLSPAVAEKFALVIGNNAYDNAPLNSPVNDANDIAAVLEDHGFKVIKRTDADRDQMLEAIRSFTRSIRSGDTALFYFSGHGVRSEDVNYLIPLEANINAPAEFDRKAVSAQTVLEKLETANSRVSIIILDACREIQNQAPGLRRGKSDNVGLAPMKAPQGTLIAYATGPGKTAADGTGRNSVYTKHLLREMRNPDLQIEEVFKRTRTKVREETNNKQTPWEESSLEGAKFCLSDPSTRRAPAGHTNPPVHTGPVDKEPRTGMKMVGIRAGQFQMGLPKANGGLRQQLVKIARPFHMGMFEVTQQQFEQVMGFNPSQFKGPNLPVDSVTWDQAVEFCSKLSKDGGPLYRLPTEAEWEYACRAGTKGEFNFGPNHAWSSANAQKKSWPGGAKQPNGWGLYDMVGNLEEWCQDPYLEDPMNLSAGAPPDPEKYTKRVSRGGCFLDEASKCHAASRCGYHKSKTRYKSQGFRVVRVSAKTSVR